MKKLSSAQRELLSFSQDLVGKELEQKNPIQVRSIEGLLPLTSAQHRIWLIHKLYPNTNAYNIGIYYTINGDIDGAKLEQHLQTLVTRHVALRTNISEIDGQPCQTYQSLQTPVLTQLSCKKADVTAKLRALEEQTFDLKIDKLYRFQLISDELGNHVLAMVFNHIISDGWSLEMFVAELANLYNEQPLTELPFSFADYTYWHNELISSGLSDSKRYWQKQFSTPVPELNLPVISKEGVSELKGKCKSYLLDISTTNKLKALGNKHKISWFMLGLSSFYLLLSLFSKNKDITISTPVAGREESELTRIFGLFANTILLRQSIDSTLNFATYFKQVKQTLLNGLQHQQLPLEEILNADGLRQVDGHIPALDCMFIFNQLDIDTINLANSIATRYELDNSSSKVPLVQEWAMEQQQLRVTFQYDVARFSPEFIESLLTAQLKICQYMANESGETLAQLEQVFTDNAFADQSPYCDRAREFWLELVNEASLSALPLTQPREAEQKIVISHSRSTMSDVSAAMIKQSAEIMQIPSNGYIQLALLAFLSRESDGDILVKTDKISPQEWYSGVLVRRALCDDLFVLYSNLTRQLSQRSNIGAVSEYWLKNIIASRQKINADVSARIEIYVNTTDLPSQDNRDDELNERGVSDKVDLSITITLKGEEVLLDCSFNEAVISHEQVAYWMEMFTDELSSSVQYERLQSSRMLAQDALITLGKAPEIYVDAKTSIFSLFIAQVESNEEKIAIDCGEQQASYQQLANMSYRIIAGMQHEGISQGDVVGISLSRKPELIATLLACLAQGVCYAPMDPKYPKDRLIFMAKDSGMKSLITDDFVSAELQEHGVAHISLARLLACQDQVTQLFSGHAKSTAYLIYTSGSTGTPKGVQVRQDNIISLCHWATTQYTDKESARILASTSLNFDISVFEVFYPLLYGYTVVLVDGASPLTIQSLNVSLVNTVPSIANALLKGSYFPANIEVINLAGEALPVNLVNELLEQGIAPRVCNLYGPSEDTVYSTIKSYREKTETVSIGRPIANTQAYILNDQLQLAEQGQPGELCLSGLGLTSGYLNRDQLNQQKFIDNPFQAGKMYRTGDLVRWLDNGDIDYLGRIDDQVKIFGLRIELGEIAHHLETFPGIDEAVVLADKVGQTSVVLKAFILLNKETEQCHDVAGELIAKIKTFLGSKMPSYMIPDQVIFRQTFPRLANGKLNKTALQLSAQSSDAVIGQPPETDAELFLHEIWINHLKLKMVDTGADFFSIGGNSLLSQIVLAEIKKLLGIGIGLDDFMDNSSIKGIVNLLANTVGGESELQERILNYRLIAGMSSEEVTLLEMS